MGDMTEAADSFEAAQQQRRRRDQRNAELEDRRRRASSTRTDASALTSVAGPIGRTSGRRVAATAGPRISPPAGGRSGADHGWEVGRKLAGQEQHLLRRAADVEPGDEADDHRGVGSPIVMSGGMLSQFSNNRSPLRVTRW